jgi:hypothetical protein
MSVYIASVPLCSGEAIYSRVLPVLHASDWNCMACSLIGGGTSTIMYMYAVNYCLHPLVGKGGAIGGGMSVLRRYIVHAGTLNYDSHMHVPASGL